MLLNIVSTFRSALVFFHKDQGLLVLETAGVCEKCVPHTGEIEAKMGPETSRYQLHFGISDETKRYQR